MENYLHINLESLHPFSFKDFLIKNGYKVDADGIYNKALSYLNTFSNSIINETHIISFSGNRLFSHYVQEEGAILENAWDILIPSTKNMAIFLFKLVFWHDKTIL